MMANTVSTIGIPKIISGIAKEMVVTEPTRYRDGAIYFDYQKGKFYKKQGSTFILVEDAETISTN